MRPVYKFTLSHDTEADQEISEPIGWMEIELNLERHEEFHSLVENFEVPLEFYGSDGTNDGGYAYITNIIDTYGPNSPLYILIEIQPNVGDAFETLFSGQLALVAHRKLLNERKIQVPVIRDDLWAKFINRRNQKVNIKGNSVNGVVVDTINQYTLSLPSQAIHQRYHGMSGGEPSYIFTGNGFGIFDMGLDIISEIEIKFNYPRVSTTDRPFELFALKFGGEYTIDSLATITSVVGNNRMLNVGLYLQINDETPIAFTLTQQGVNGVNGTTKFTYSDTHTLERGDFIRIYFENTGGSGNDFIMLATEGLDQTELMVEANTLYEPSSTPAFWIYDVVKGISDRVLDKNNSFYSEYFGGTDTHDEYPEDGCGAHHALMKGLHVRGYSLTAKPFTLSFDDFWAGSNPIFGLGLGYETIGGYSATGVIRIERMTHFYDGSSNSVELENVMDVESGIDASFFLKRVKGGYQKWQAQSASGIDDPQTVREYVDQLNISGEEKLILSQFYAASLGIEQTRRNRLQEAEDWTLDEEIMIIQTDNEGSPGGASPKLYTESSDLDITNLLNPETRYNIKLTPFINMKRWGQYFRIARDSGLTFVSGEGNFIMGFEAEDDQIEDCDSDIGIVSGGINPTAEWDENDNVIATPRLHSSVTFSFEHPLTYVQYKAIRDNRKKSIGFSYIDADGVEQHIDAFIKKLNFVINESKARFELWEKQ